MESRNLSVIIPTLQKDFETLNNLVLTFSADKAVQEIIVIDNSLKGCEFASEKVRVIVPKENLFVNPSWNLGVREAKNEYVCLANDDIRIPNDFCTKVLENFSDKIGIVGMSPDYTINTRNKNNEVIIDIYKIKQETSKNVKLEPIKFRPESFGIIMFFKKENYVEIPDDLKIFFGDDWIIYQAQKKGKKNQICTGQEIYHLGSLSSNRFADAAKLENKIYWNYILPKYKRMLKYVETYTHYIMYIFGVKLALKKKRNKII